MTEEYEGKNRRRWQVKREVSLGDLIAIVSAVVAVLYSYATLDKRVSILEDAKAAQIVVDNRQDAEALRYQARIDEQLREINRKLDRIIERRP